MQITASILEDQGNILGGVLHKVTNGHFTAVVAAVLAGQKTATIQVKAGNLSRIITVMSTELYRFDPAAIAAAYSVSHFLNDWTLVRLTIIRSGTATLRFTMTRLPNHSVTSFTALREMMNCLLAL